MKILLITLLSLFISLPALATDDATAFLSEAALAKNEKTITRLEDYLSGLSTIVADFTQTAPDGSISGGKFYMQRPGKMRWQYNPPTPILMVSDGKTLTFFDRELEQVNYISLDDTLIDFLALEKITFSGTVGIIKFEEKNKVIRVTLAKRAKPNEGKLMLEFSDKPLTIRNMVVTDANRQVTTVSLNNAQYGQTLGKELFIFRDPRKKRL